MSTLSPVSAPLLVAGAGSWGTALAIHLAQKGQSVRLWGIAADDMRAMAEQRINRKYLPNHPFPEQLTAFADVKAAQCDADDWLIAVPSHAFAECLDFLLPLITPRTRIVWATKGLDPRTGDTLDKVAMSILPAHVPLAVIAGPSFAKEVASGLPTAVTIASKDLTFAQDLATRFQSDVFRPYLNTDMVGVQLCGAVKNPVAVAAGISDGLGYGSNAACALITRALAEMTRLGLAAGGDAATFTGLAGLGDLVLTCTDNQSRNRRFGVAIGQGQSFDQAAKAVGQVVEGRGNAFLVRALAAKLDVSMPIIDCICGVLENRLSPEEAVKALFQREVKSEA